MSTKKQSRVISSYKITIKHYQTKIKELKKKEANDPSFKRKLLCLEEAMAETQTNLDNVKQGRSPR